MENNTEQQLRDGNSLRQFLDEYIFGSGWTQELKDEAFAKISAYIENNYFTPSELEEAKKEIEQLKAERDEVKRLKCIAVESALDRLEVIKSMFTREQVEKVWDAALRRKSYEDRVNYVPQTEDEYREAVYEASRELIQPPPPDKQTTINNLLNPGKDGK